MNIYKNSAKRLSAFEQMTEGCDEEDDMFFGTSSAYEFHLDNRLKCLHNMDNQQKQVQAAQMQQNYNALTYASQVLMGNVQQMQFNAQSVYWEHISLWAWIWSESLIKEWDEDQIWVIVINIILSKS